MAIRPSVNGGNFSDATTWQTLTANSTAGTSTVALTNTPLSSEVFTAPNTTNACLGVVALHFGLTQYRTSTYFAKLQEYNGATWVDVATASVPESTLDYTTEGVGTTTYLYFKLPTPYTFTTTSTGYYRWQFYRDATLGGNPTFRRDSVSARVTHWTIDDRTGAPAASDFLLIVSDPNSPVDVILDGDATIGDASMPLGTAFVASTLTNPLLIGHSGNLKWDTTQSSTLTCNGCISVLYGGKFGAGTLASPFPAAYNAKLVFHGSTLANNAGFNTNTYGYHADYAECISFVGQPKANRGWYSSGVGTSASPLITTTATDWNVGDEICVSGNVYNQYEIRYIITKNSTSSYVLSTSVGGAEAAFTNAHTANTLILNGTHNVSIESDTISVPFWGLVSTYKPLAAPFKDMTLRYTGGSGASRNGFYNGTSAALGIYHDGVTIVDAGYGLYAFYSYYTTRTDSQCTNGAIYRMPVALGGGTSTGSMYTLSEYVGTYNNIYCIGGAYISVQISAYSITVSDIHVYNAVANYSSGYQGGALTISGAYGTFLNCSSQGCRTNGITCGGTGLIVKDSNFGTIVTNNYDINPTYQGSFLQTLFDNCNFGSANKWSSPLTDLSSSPFMLTAGSYISFDNCDGGNEKISYFPRGIVQKTGTGLDDTTLSPLGQNCGLVSPVNLVSGQSFEFKVLAVPNQSVSVFGKLKKNAVSTADVATVELWLPGSNSADVSYTMPNGTDWNTFALGTNYTGTEYSWATVKVICKSNTTGAGFYIGDIYNGTNNITNLNLWYQAKQSDIMFEQLGDANAVWSVLTSTQTTAGTMGKKLVDGTVVSDLDPLM